MQIVIDIPNDHKRVIDNLVTDGKGYLLPNEVEDTLAKAVKAGTPLPKGHWIHRTQDGGCFWEECSVCHTERAFSTKYCPDCGTYMYADIRIEAPTIIEADKAESEVEDAT